MSRVSLWGNRNLISNTSKNSVDSGCCCLIPSGDLCPNSNQYCAGIRDLTNDYSQILILFNSNSIDDDQWNVYISPSSDASVKTFIGNVDLSTTNDGVDTITPAYVWMVDTYDRPTSISEITNLDDEIWYLMQSMQCYLPGNAPFRCSGIIDIRDGGLIDPETIASGLMTGHSDIFVPYNRYKNYLVFENAGSNTKGNFGTIATACIRRYANDEFDPRTFEKCGPITQNGEWYITTLQWNSGTVIPVGFSDFVDLDGKYITYYNGGIDTGDYCEQIPSGNVLPNIEIQFFASGCLESSPYTYASYTGGNYCRCEPMAETGWGGQVSRYLHVEISGFFGSACECSELNNIFLLEWKLCHKDSDYANSPYIIDYPMKFCTWHTKIRNIMCDVDEAKIDLFVSIFDAASPSMYATVMLYSDHMGTIPLSRSWFGLITMYNTPVGHTPELVGNFIDWEANCDSIFPHHLHEGPNSCGFSDESVLVNYSNIQSGPRVGFHIINIENVTLSYTEGDGPVNITDTLEIIDTSEIIDLI